MIRISVSTALLALIALGLLSCKPKLVSTPLLTPSKHNPSHNILNVRLNDDVTATIDDTTYTLDELTSHLKAERANIDGVLLKVSPDQPMDDVVSMLKCLEQAGIESISFTDPSQVETEPHE